MVAQQIEALTALPDFTTPKPQPTGSVLGKSTPQGNLNRTRLPPGSSEDSKVVAVGECPHAHRERIGQVGEQSARNQIGGCRSLGETYRSALGGMCS